MDADKKKKKIENLKKLMHNMQQSKSKSKKKYSSAFAKKNQYLHDDTVIENKSSFNSYGNISNIASSTFDIHEEKIVSDNGTVSIFSVCYPLDYFHGMIPLNKALESKTEVLRLITGDPAVEAIDISKALFFDTETTGLAQNSGTYIFLMGIGFFRKGEFCLRQYFLPSFEDEPAFIELIEKEFSAYKFLISFNGKNYDLPLLKIRFLMNGKPFPFSALPHADLLQCARRLWRRRLGRYNLINLERQILDFNRVDDIPGADIPAIYGIYRFKQDIDMLQQVFYHNRLDILSMVTLLHFITYPLSKKNLPTELDADDLYSIGKIYQNRNLFKEAITFYKIACKKSNVPELSQQIRKELANLLKKQGNFEEAIPVWKQMILEKEIFSPLPYEELAKYWEHKEKKYKKAQKICEEALERLELLDDFSFTFNMQDVFNSLQHRLKRLIRKQK